MIKRTSMNLDLELVAAARRVLGTKGTTETVHQALREAVRQEARRRLVRRRFEPERADWLRRPAADERPSVDPVGAR